MRLRSTLVAAVLAAGVSVPLSGTALAADLDCKDFPNQAAAQTVLDADRSDPNGLDADHDGQACEEFTFQPAATGTAEARPVSVPVPLQVPSAAAAGQVSTRPVGGVAAGDGSGAGPSSEGPFSGPLPLVLGGVAFAAAGGAALAGRRAAAGRR
ncbi:excalibur calcium-binding domain-containing protein [Modestobacter sp. NPDC049651]|uniref:excalibur calcium-binding domain-containing protein n=1 Tax=unclassified Modestobacter TaxID=2643866 RepID=UPI0033EDEA81